MRQPRADDGIVPVEPECHGLAHQHLFADTSVDQPGDLVLRGRSAPRRFELASKADGVGLGHLQPRGGDGRWRVVQRGEEGEDAGTQHEEMQ